MILHRFNNAYTFGSKPRASGDDPTGGIIRRRTLLVNPARAGMILMGNSSRKPRSRKPRASGDDPNAYTFGKHEQW